MKMGEKLKIIESMGIDWEIECPSVHGLVNADSKCAVINRNDVAEKCSACWIKSLEVNGMFGNMITKEDILEIRNLLHKKIMSQNPGIYNKFNRIAFKIDKILGVAIEGEI